MKPDEIYEAVCSIMEDKKSMTLQHLEIKWKEFMNEYPMIFLSVTQNDVDKDILKNMIEKLKKIEDSSMSKEAAELEIGDNLAKRYIYDKFEKPSDSAMESAYKRALEKNFF
jgi:hypothetical protein